MTETQGVTNRGLLQIELRNIGMMLGHFPLTLGVFAEEMHAEVSYDTNYISWREDARALFGFALRREILSERLRLAQERAVGSRRAKILATYVDVVNAYIGMHLAAADELERPQLVEAVTSGREVGQAYVARRSPRTNGITAVGGYITEMSQ